MHGENALHTTTEANATHGKRLAQKLTAAAHHHAFKRLNAFLGFLAFLQADIHPDCVTRTKHGMILAELGLLHFRNYWFHDSFSGRPAQVGPAHNEQLSIITKPPPPAYTKIKSPGGFALGDPALSF